MVTEDLWSAEKYVKNASFVPQMTSSIVEMAKLKPTDRVLDIGCGDGVLTKKLSSQCAHVIGVDASDNLLKAAKAKALEVYRIPGQDILQAKTVLPDASFDVVFSNAAFHWILRKPEERAIVMQGVHRVLRKGGRFVVEAGGFGNVAEAMTSIYAFYLSRGVPRETIDDLCPFYFGSEHGYMKLLEDAGFQVESIGIFDRPTPLVDDVRGWIDTFAFNFYSAFPEWKQDLLDFVYQAMKFVSEREDGRWFVQYKRLRFSALKP
ncbi:methyltransferase [Schizosaccharomyces japonicus yFS275]|uniref:Methyltransferase n=1 Tax=Schizosaccharomyces japonicus (strain yFS275 / FY16936) TaxID=402676 RepID=B6K7E9_SCHJY|nr:methyltransferase [Schizosaccharomyces japonicus yFS275]EEB09453.1 methyltransferase [Schizosaccharomyces japonicus yFS275]